MCKKITTCCLLDDHKGPHMFKCAGKFCPGLTWAASNMPHPSDCYINYFETYLKNFVKYSKTLNKTYNPNTGKEYYKVDAGDFELFLASASDYLEGLEELKKQNKGGEE